VNLTESVEVLYNLSLNYIETFVLKTRELLRVGRSLKFVSLPLAVGQRYILKSAVFFKLLFNFPSAARKVQNYTKLGFNSNFD